MYRQTIVEKLMNVEKIHSITRIHYRTQHLIHFSEKNANYRY